MSRRPLRIAPDSFKGFLTSAQAADGGEGIVVLFACKPKP